MKPSAFLINVACAEIVNEDALYHVLSERQIADAALDVWRRYSREEGPVAPATQPFLELANARARLIAEDIRRVAGRAAALNLVCP